MSRMGWLKAALGISIAALSAATAATALPIPPRGYNWKVNPGLSDEFDGSSLDHSKWISHHPYWNGPEPGQFSDQNVTVQNGYAALKTDVAPEKTDAKGRWIRTACISSIGPIAGYGYYEARIKGSLLPTLSSFWFQNSTSEIDVQEGSGDHLSFRSNYMMNSTLHYFVGGKPGLGDTATRSRPFMMKEAVSDWHTYGVWWRDSHTIIFYLDGREVGRQSPARGFDSPMYLFLDTEQHKGRLPTRAELSDNSLNTMLVDWVHAYTLQRR